MKTTITRRTTLILIAFVMATGCGDNGSPVGPSTTPVIDVRPVDPRFGKLFWQQLVFDQYDDPGVWLRSLVLDTTSPNVYIWLGNAAGQRVVLGRHVTTMRRLIPRAMMQLTGHVYRGRVETGMEDRKRLGWITVRFDSPYSNECGSANIGGNPGSILISWPFCDDDEYFPSTFVHELGHAMGFFHVKTYAAVMSHVGNSRSTFTPREQYHSQLAYEVGRGHEYCGWPFQRSCATPKRVPRTLGVARVVID